MAARLLLLFCAVTTLARAQGEAHFPIREVTLFGGEAQVERRTELQLAAGSHSLQLMALSNGLRDDSLEVRIDPPNLEIKALKITPRNVQLFHSDQAEEARRYHDQARRQLERLTHEYQVLKEEEKSLLALRVSIPEPRQKIVLEPRSWEGNLNFVQDSLRRNQSRMLELLDQIDQARVDFRIAETVLDRYRSSEARRVKDISFVVDAPQAVRAKLSLIYRLQGASWFPAYSARVTTTGRNPQLKLTLYAMARNQSGESWENVRFAFSAARPPFTGALPELREWRIRASDRPTALPAPRQERSRERLDFADEPAPQRAAGATSAPFQPVPAPELQSKSKGQDYYQQNLNTIQEKRARQKADEITRELDILEQNKKESKKSLEEGRYGAAVKESNAFIESIQSLPARAQELFREDLDQAREVRRKSLEMLESEKIIARLRSPEGFDHEYRAAFPETIHSDNAFHKILLLEKEYPVALSYEIAAEKNRLAYLTGEATNSGDPLLHGPASVYHNQDYAGESIIQTTGNGEAFRLYLGADEDLAVERSVQDFRERAGLLGGDFRYKRKVSVSIANRKRIAAKITLLERIPVSSDENLKIEGIQFSRNPDRRDPSGLLAFDLNLPAGSKDSTRIEYNVRYPARTRPAYREEGAPTW